MYRKCKLVMLPTNEKAIKPNNLILGRSGKLYKTDLYCNNSQGYYISQHIYIILDNKDDKINADDWCYHFKSKTLQNPKTPEAVEYANKECKKIISTTDSSLTKIVSDFDFMSQQEGEIEIPALPQPTQSFIQECVDEYNDGTKIKNILVEYEEIEVWDKDTQHMVVDYELKVSKDNTITIRRVKDSYSRDEVIEKLRDMHLDIVDGDYSKGLNKWIEDNL